MFEIPKAADVKTWMLDQTTGALALAALNAMALGLRFKPGASEHLYGVRSDGTEIGFAGSYVFTTSDGDVAVHAIMKDGRMRVGRGPLERPSVTVRLKDKATLRKFFSPRTDSLGMLLENEMSFDGNLAYLARFDHLSKVLKLGDAPLPPTAADPPSRWQDLRVPPTGEPCSDPPRGEVTHLEEPYFAAQTLDDWPRLKRLLWTHRTRAAELDPERALLLTEFKHAAGQRSTARGHAISAADADTLNRRVFPFWMDAFYDHVTAQRNYRGGQYLPGYWSMSNHVAFGILSGALPSGRRRGEPFTPGLTPSPLAGAPLTEQIRTVAELDGLKMPNNIAFNLKLVPGATDQHQQVLDRMTAYVQAYTDLGGMQIQFNMVSSETLRHAMENPAEYRDLLVRISGYNAYFVELNADMQSELIKRMEHSLT